MLRCVIRGHAPLALSHLNSAPENKSPIAGLILLCLRVIDFEQDPSDSPTCKTPSEEEQFLCNEALRTGDFDTMSDREWIALCEQAASKRRRAARTSACDDPTTAGP